MSFNRSDATLSLCLWLLCLPASADQSLMVPPDRSLRTSGYTDRGLPAIESVWDSADTQKAWTVLQDLHAEDPALLPRYGSPRSGPVFDKLLAQAFTMNAVFAAVGDVPVGKLETILEEEPESIAELTLLSVYRVRPDTGIFFDRENVEILALAAERNVDLWQEMKGHLARTDERIAKADTSGREELVRRIQESQDLLRETLASMEGMFLSKLVALVSIVEVPGVSPAAANAALGHADRLLAKSWDLLSAEGRRSAEHVLVTARRKPTSE